MVTKHEISRFQFVLPAVSFGTIELLMNTMGGTRNPLFMKHHLFSSDEGIQGMLMEGCCQKFTPPLRAMAQSVVTTGFMTRRPWHKKLRL
jgi:hypothetical protein